MMVSMMVVECSASPPPFVDVLGQGLIASDKVRLFDVTRNNFPTFRISIATSYQLRLVDIVPAVNIGLYTIMYGDRPLYSTVLRCPMGMSGVYYIDSSRVAMRDTYNNELKKIPPPTIRTALIGE